MENTPATPGPRFRPVKLLLVAFLAGLVAVAIWSLPRGYSADLSQVGQGRNVVVHVHDHYLVSSTALMNSLNRLRRDYAGEVEFVVADLQVPDGRAFAERHRAEAATLLLFAADGTRLGVVQGAHDPAELRAILNQVYRRTDGL